MGTQVHVAVAGGSGPRATMPLDPRVKRVRAEARAARRLAAGLGVVGSTLSDMKRVRDTLPTLL